MRGDGSGAIPSAKYQHKTGWSPRRNAFDLDDRLEQEREVLIARIVAMCDWSNPDLDTPGTHQDWHYGGPCPYEQVIPALLRGERDPRRLMGAR